MATVIPAMPLLSACFLRSRFFPDRLGVARLPHTEPLDSGLAESLALEFDLGVSLGKLEGGSLRVSSSSVIGVDIGNSLTVSY